MSLTEHLIRGYSKKDSIDAIYYAVRYLRDPDRLPKDSQELFADGIESLPSKQAVTLTKKLLASIEARAGKSVAELNSSAVLKAVDDLILAAGKLDDDITPIAEAAAKRWIERNRMENVGAQPPLSAGYAAETVMDMEPAVARADLAGYSSSR